MIEAMTSVTLAAVIGIVGVTTPARADGPGRALGPIEVRAGLAVTMDRFSIDVPGHTDTVTRFGPEFHGDVGYRILPDLSAGIHVGLTRNWDTEMENRPPCGYYYFRMAYTSIQLGINVTYTVGDRAWFSPWVGIDFRETMDRDGDGSDATWARQFAFGLSAGADFWKPSGALHRLGAYVDVARGSHESTPGSSWVERDVYVSAGVAYRYR